MSHIFHFENLLNHSLIKFVVGKLDKDNCCPLLLIVQFGYGIHLNYEQSEITLQTCPFSVHIVNHTNQFHVTHDYK